MKKLNRVLKDKQGAISLEATLVIFIVLPILLSLILGSFQFFTAQSHNIDLNYAAGRYVSMSGCSIEELGASMASSEKFAGYTITVHEDGNSAVIAEGGYGQIEISCLSDSQKGDEFGVTTVLPISQATIYRFFPLRSAQHGIYVQEAKR